MQRGDNDKQVPPATGTSFFSLLKIFNCQSWNLKLERKDKPKQKKQIILSFADPFTLFKTISNVIAILHSKVAISAGIFFQIAEGGKII